MQRVIDDEKGKEQFDRVGVHVGNKGNINYAVALTKDLFLDFIYNALKELNEKHGEGSVASST